jgi:hypothetical protein
MGADIVEVPQILTPNKPKLYSLRLPFQITR